MSNNILGKFFCPECCSEDITFAEDVTHYYTVCGVSPSEEVVVKAKKFNQSISNGHNVRFICNKCSHTWATDQQILFTF